MHTVVMRTVPGLIAGLLFLALILAIKGITPQ